VTAVAHTGTRAIVPNPRRRAAPAPAQVLEEIRQDDALQHIPVVMLTTSQAEHDTLESYRLRASAYVTRPVDLEQFLSVVVSIEQFWLEIVKLSGP